MTITVQLYERDFSTILRQPIVTFEPQRLVWDIAGGPAEATIKVSGARVEVLELLEYLRAPITLSADSEVIWNGYVESVSTRVNQIMMTVSLENMANKVCVVYAEVNTAGSVGERKETTWYMDADSIATYGTKEKRSSMTQGTADEAATRAQTILGQLKYPLCTHEFSGGSGTEMTEATLTCRGWWETLDWMYYANNAGKESYEDIGNGLQALGDTGTCKILAQSFTVSSGTTWSAQTIKLRMRREGYPTDTLTVTIRANSGSQPGDVLSTATILGSEVNENLNWHELKLGTKLTMTPGTTYWIVAERTGGESETAYYKLDANEDVGYPNGMLRMWNGSAWVARTPDADLLFQVGGVDETTNQLSRILTIGGQFFTGVQLNTASGVFSSPYRDGDQTGLVYVKELLESGSTNLRRLQATVDTGRTVVISEEPASGADDCYFMTNGDVLDSLGRVIPKYKMRPGWFKLADFLPANVDSSRLTDPSRTFVERVYFNVADGGVEWQERNYQGLFN